MIMCGPKHRMVEDAEDVQFGDQWYVSDAEGWVTIHENSLCNRIVGRPALMLYSTQHGTTARWLIRREIPVG